MTQLHFFSKAIRRRNTERFHAEASLHAAVHGAKIKSLEEVLALESEVIFDEKTDEFLEQQALKRLQEAQAKHGRR